MLCKRNIFAIIIIIVGFIGLLCCDNRYKNDFYNDVNKKKIDNIKLGNNKYTWSVFNDAQDNSDKRVKQIVRDIVHGNDKKIDSDIGNKISIIWNELNDIDSRKSIGIIGKYLDRVNDSNDMNELLDSIILIENDLGVDILTNISVNADYKDNSKYIIFLEPVTYSFGGNSDYFVNADYMTYKAYLMRGIVELLRVYGYDRNKARGVMHDIVDFYEKIGNKSKLSSDLEDIRQYYNIIGNKDIEKIYSNIDIKYYLNRRGIYSYNNYSIVDEGQYRAINDSFKKDYLDIWKEIIKVKVLSSYGYYLSNDYVGVIDNINNGIMGIESDKSLEDKNIDIIESLFSNDVDFVFSDVLKSNDKKRLSSMIDDIRDYYKKMINNNKWLSDDTKKYAIEKLDKISIHIGLEEYDKISTKYNIRNTSLIDNVIEIFRVNREEEYRLLSDSKGKGPLLSQSSVNAYYAPLENAIYIPSAIKYLYDEDDSYYQLLGSIGMVIAHEMTHAFDTNGALFDSNGNMNNWWSDKDLEKYNKYRNEVIDYYNEYKVINGKHINGKKTVNENIADLGAVACISGIATSNKASEKEIKDMYYSFANMWASKESSQYSEMLLLQDSHSPNKYRVNATLSSTDLYYKIFDVNIWNKMYKKNRVKVW